MRRRLLGIAALVLTAIIAVAVALVIQIRRSQGDLTQLWARADSVNEAMGSAAVHIGRIEAALAADRRGTKRDQETPPAVAELVQPDLEGLDRQLAALAPLVNDEAAHARITDVRLLAMQLGASLRPRTTPSVAGAAVTEPRRTIPRLRQAFDRLWMRYSEINRQDVTRYTMQQTRQTGQLLLVIVVAALVGCVLAGYHILRVADLLDDFIGAARRLSEGDWAHRVAAPPTRELRDLADSFNHMADAICRAEAERMEAAREMLVTLNHEVGNAAGSISGLVQLLRRHEMELAPNVVSALRQIEDTIGRLSRTVARLQDFSSLRVADYPGGLKMFTVGEPTPVPREPAASGERPRGP